LRDRANGYSKPFTIRFTKFEETAAIVSNQTYRPSDDPHPVADEAQRAISYT
jgi:hypothetical protein